MLNYNHLYYFHVVATEGSIAAAAAHLGVTQPTVSEQVRALERSLDVRMFDRVAGGIKLTDEGRLAYDHTSVMFRAGERLVESLVGDDHVLPHVLRVGLTNGIARAVTTDFLMPLLALDSCVPTIRTGDPLELLRELRDGDLDLALVESEPVEHARKNLQSVQIDEIRLVAVAAVSLELAPGWAGAGIVHYRGGSPHRWEVEAYLEEHDLHPAIVAEADDPSFMLEAAARGGFVAFVPWSVARDAVVANRVRVVARLTGTPTTVHALYPDGAAAELARRAVEVLVAYARSNTE